MILGRPLIVRLSNDCLPPDPSCLPPSTQRIVAYYFQFSRLAREVHTTAISTTTTIDAYTDRFTALLHNLPSDLRFQPAWLNAEIATPPWPVDAQAASLHLQVHSYIIFLCKHGSETTKAEPLGQEIIGMKNSTFRLNLQVAERGSHSCREILRVFRYLSTRQRRGWIDWSLCQHTYNAAILLGHSLPKTGDSDDKLLLAETFQSFSEIHKLGIHHLAGPAAVTLESILALVQAKPKLVGSRSHHTKESSLDSSEIQLVSTNMGPKTALSCPAKSIKAKYKAAKEQHMRGASENAIANSKQKPRIACSKGSKTDDTRRSRGKQSQSQSTGEPGASSGQFSYGNELGLATERSVASKNNASGSLQEPHGQYNKKSANTASSSSTSTSSCPEITRGGQELPTPNLPIDGWMMDHFFTDRQPPLSISTDVANLLPLMSPDSQANVTACPSQPPSLSGRSYPSSIYTNSVPSALHTPSASHPVSPLLSHGNLGATDDTQAKCCNGQPILHPQTPPWPSDTFQYNDGTQILRTSSNVLEQADSMRWIWSTSTPW